MKLTRTFDWSTTITEQVHEESHNPLTRVNFFNSPLIAKLLVNERDPVQLVSKNSSQHKLMRR